MDRSRATAMLLSFPKFRPQNGRGFGPLVVGGVPEDPIVCDVLLAKVSCYGPLLKD